MYAIIFVLLSVTTLFAQPWESSAISLTPQPYTTNWSQLHVLPVADGQTAIASSRWDWPPVAMYDSLGHELWCNCGDDLSVEMRRPHSLGLFNQSSGFVAMFYSDILGDPESAFGWEFGEPSGAQAINLHRRSDALFALNDGNNSFFLCRYINNSKYYFVAAASDSGELWQIPLYRDDWTDIPIDFCISTGHGIAYVCNHEVIDSCLIALNTISSDGAIGRSQFLQEDSIHVPVRVAQDNVAACWAIGVQDSDVSSNDLYLYYAEDYSYHTIPLGFSIPPVTTGNIPTLHAIPFGDGIMIAGEAELESGEHCLFTLTYSASGAARIDTILGYEKMLDIAANGYDYTAAVRETPTSVIQLLRARSLVSAADDPVVAPLSFKLSSYPNPFNAQTTITFDLPRAGNVTLTLFDVLGREVETLLNEKMNAGSHTLNYSASALPSGVYFAALKSGGVSTTQKLLLLK